MGNFYYTVTPFELKNIGATYQRAMATIFHDMMHQELEDYVDDIMVKLRRREEHFHVLKRVFERCRAFKLWMNPLKCAFGVSSEIPRLSGSQQGNTCGPGQSLAIATMRPLAIVKELKSFLRKISYIQRCIPMLALITSTFTKLLRKRQSFE